MIALPVHPGSDANSGDSAPAAPSPAASRWLPEIALLLLIGALFATGIHAFGMFTWDEAEYATLGRSIARGEGYAIGGRPQYLRVPLLPLAIAAAVSIAGTSSDTAVRSVPLGLALLTVATALAFTRKRYGRTVAAAAAVLCAVAPGFLMLVPQALTDIAFAGLFAAAVWSFHLALADDARWMWASAAAAALSFLMRYTAALFFPAAAVLAAAALLRDRGAARRIFAPRTAMAALLAVAIVSPWFVRAALLAGDPWIGLRWAGHQVQSYSPGASFAWYAYFRDLPQILGIPTLAFLAAGAIDAIRSRDRFAVDSLLVAAVVVVYFSCFRYKEARFVIAIVPLLAPVAATGLFRLAEQLTGARNAPRAVALSLAIVAALMTLPAVAYFRAARTNGFPSFLEAAACVRRISPPGSRILSSISPQVAWYCDRRTGPLPLRREALAAAAASAELVVVTNFERGQPPWAEPLVSGRGLPAGCSARLFSDERFSTTVIPASCFSRR